MRGAVYASHDWPGVLQKPFTQLQLAVRVSTTTGGGGAESVRISWTS